MNNWDELICSGALINKITSHSPNFATINAEFMPNDSAIKSIPKYDLSDVHESIYSRKAINDINTRSIQLYNKINSIQGKP